MNLPKLTAEQERDVVHSILDVTSRQVGFVFDSGLVDCPVCGGNDPFCATCGGNRKIRNTVTVSLPAKVKWTAMDDRIYTKLGQAVDGDCLLTLPVTESGALYQASGYALETLVSATVDGRLCTVDKWYFKGDPINRVYIVLHQDEGRVQRIG